MVEPLRWEWVYLGERRDRVNYFNLLWNLYQQKRNTKKTKQQIESLQKRKLHKMLRYAYEHSPYYRGAFEAAGITADNIEKTPLHRLQDRRKTL